jgi:crotonobetainyl-CoA:carnitine CoA-transferase CaiB-like acyl-CoA transferase
MTAPLEGIRVLEVASWLAAPSCAALLADMGAEVIKVEPPGGDSYRKLYDSLLGAGSVHPCFQFDNRGKRGVCVNLEDPEGLEMVRTLAKDVDIFLTNLTQARLERYQLTDTDIKVLSPGAIYAVLSGYGTKGPDSERQAFDQTAFWARSGAMAMFGDRDDGPLLSRGGYGDRITALNLLSAILAAMRIKDKTGDGQYVEVTLQRTGVWAMASDVTMALYDRVDAEKTSQKAPGNPIWNYYRASDDRWFAMVMPFAVHYWPKFCAMLGRDDWATDERFLTTLGLAEHGPSLIPELNDLFASQDLEYWREQLDNAGLIWEPIALVTEVIEDPALRERGAFSVVVHEKAGALEIVSAPFVIRNADIEVRGPAPDVGQHTREVFEEFGVDAGEIESMIERGVLQ